GKQFFNELIEFMMTGPIVAFILEGPDCVKVVRNMIGATDFLQAQPGTVRGDYSLSTGKNLIHGSDSVEIATKEISLLFRKDEIQDWKSPISEYVY
ncbi:nucleoside-diphosphate kinase, partial [bacterium]